MRYEAQGAYRYRSGLRVPSFPEIALRVRFRTSDAGLLIDQFDSNSNLVELICFRNHGRMSCIEVRHLRID
jgi:hypothetical protein